MKTFLRAYGIPSRLPTLLLSYCGGCTTARIRAEGSGSGDPLAHKSEAHSLTNAASASMRVSTAGANNAATPPDDVMLTWERTRALLALGGLVAAMLLTFLPQPQEALQTTRRRRQDAEECAINLIDDTPPEEPLILKKNCVRNTCTWQLPEGDKGLHFNKGDEVLLACTGKGNSFQGLTEHPTSVLGIVKSCPGSKSIVLEVDHKRYTVQDLACSRISKGEIKNKNKNCGPRNAVLLELGFTVQGKWYPLIEVCHVVSRSDTLFTQHMLEGESEDKRRTVQRPSFEVGSEFYQGVSPNTAYQNSNKTLQALLGRNSVPTDVSIAIDRGHLSPDGDFLIGPYRFATYFYVNTVPMWRVINTGNWLLMENMLRKYAKSKSVDLQIATGVFRVLELKNSNGDLKEFFLHSTNSRKQIPVPKYIWKVAYNKATKEGIAFVIINDPFKKSLESSDVLCPNICDKSGWGRKDNRWEVINKGYLFCCEVKELKKFVSYVPKFDVKSILVGS